MDACSWVFWNARTVPIRAPAWVASVVRRAARRGRVVDDLQHDALGCGDVRVQLRANPDDPGAYAGGEIESREGCDVGAEPRCVAGRVRRDCAAIRGRRVRGGREERAIDVGAQRVVHHVAVLEEPLRIGQDDGRGVGRRHPLEPDQRRRADREREQQSDHRDGRELATDGESARTASARSDRLQGIRFHLEPRPSASTT